MLRVCCCGGLEDSHRGGEGGCRGCSCGRFSYDHNADVVVIYHGGCTDGFGAAYAAWLRFGDRARYIPAEHGGDPPPEVNVGDQVYICDFSYPREAVLGLADRIGVKTWGGRLVILDHHKTAMEALGDLEFAHFDMDQSGAVITWRHFHPDTPVPAFFRYIQDRDLWTNELPDTREFSAGLRSHPQEFGVWDSLRVDDLIRDGAGIVRYIDLEVGSLLRQAPLYVPLGGYVVPVINGPAAWASEICQRLLSDSYPVAACRQQVDGEWRWELRSAGDHDVGAIAKEHGGGGHRNAAGFSGPGEQAFRPEGR
jgi:oligoribonuclease NrnB/cAMP/cGMP phosphodiesterase (DHH superfamily)